MRRSTPFDWLVVGLGNPGKQFSGTRHNVGEQVISELARRHDASLKSGRNNALVAEARIRAQTETYRQLTPMLVMHLRQIGLAAASIPKPTVRTHGARTPGKVYSPEKKLLRERL